MHRAVVQPILHLWNSLQRELVGLTLDWTSTHDAKLGARSTGIAWKVPTIAGIRPTSPSTDRPLDNIMEVFEPGMTLFEVAGLSLCVGLGFTDVGAAGTAELELKTRERSSVQIELAEWPRCEE